MIPGSASPFFLGSSLAAATSGGLQISRSLRFNSSDSAFCSRTPASAGNRKTWTWAGWAKRSDIGSSSRDILFSNDSGSYSDTSIFQLGFYDNQFLIYGYLTNFLVTTAVYRDPSAYYHVVVSLDTTQATASNRLKLYINGSEVTTFSTDGRSSITQNGDYGINQAVSHSIGRQAAATTHYFDGYLADIYFIDGQALTPSSFTETDATTGQLIPKAFSGGSYGTNGFHLDFADNSAATATTLGKDTSGNSPANNWTPNNFSVSTGVSVAAASGALPIFNTTDAYGKTLGSGVRTDAFASNLVLDLPMGTSAGLSLTDQSPTGRTSGIKTITNEGITNSTSVTKFYGGSAFFNNAAGGDIGITTPNSADFNFGTGDFTIEFWIYNIVNNRRQWFLRTSGQDDNAGSGFLVEIGVFNQMYVGGTTLLFSAQSLNTWNHYAFTRSGTTLRCFINGQLDNSLTNSSNVTSANDLFIGKNLSGYSFGCNMYLQDLRIYKGVAKYTSAFSVPDMSVAAGNDSLVDVPTSSGTDTGAGGEVRGNYCTLNPLQYGGSVNAPTNGNLDITSASSGYGGILGTIGMSAGKWYFEFTPSTSNCALGIAKQDTPVTSYLGQYAGAYIYLSNGNKANNNSYVSYGSTFTSGDVIGVAFDADNGTLTFYKNNTSQGQAYSGLTSGPYMPALSDDFGSAACNGSFNFGQRQFAYTSPAGFKALCTANLPGPLITKPNTVMDVLLYTGNGATPRSITGLNFSPDLVWTKKRSASGGHGIFDVIRGSNPLGSNNTADETTNAQYGRMSSFDSAGFTVMDGTAGSAQNDIVNANGATYAAWTWDAGSSTVTNTQGSITGGSQVRANPSAGFSIVTYTGATSSTVGHGLGVAPGLIILKQRDNAANWPVYHSSLGVSSVPLLDSTTAPLSLSNYWGSSVTSTTFGTASNGAYANAFGSIVAYCFAPVVGYSNGFSYTGNGSADGPMVYLGFRPRFIIQKRTDAAGSWLLIDTARDPVNVARNELFANSSAAEYDNTSLLDVLSNGFKIRATFANMNASGGTYIGFAWAESPFNYSRAR